MADGRKLKVFLCHSKDDKRKVRDLYRRLISDGFNAWLDEEKLLPGQNWDFEIRKAIRETDIVIACLSTNSVTKAGYVQKEIKFALDVAAEQPEAKTFIIPARFEDCAVPERLRHLQWVNLFEHNGYKKMADSLRLQMDYLNIRFDSNEVLPKTIQERIRIPILGSIAADLALPLIKPHTVHMIDSEANAVDIARSLLASTEKGDDLFALDVKGDSLMDAMINDGDIVVLKPARNVRNGEMVVVWLQRENEVTLKYFFKEKDRYRLQSANPEMKPVFLRKDEQFGIKGKVIMVIRRMDKFQ